MPGGCSLSAPSSAADGPATASAPTAIPAAAGRERDERRLARAAGGDPGGVKPSARWTPIAPRRRWTSACAPAASIVPAPSRATSENATSSEITIPAACDSSTRTPSRVTNDSEPMPNEVTRACASVTSARAGSRSQSSARSGRISSLKPNASRTSCSPT